MRDETVGVYLHVPFCERVCPYCDFAVVARRTLSRAEEERTVAALLAELARRRGDFEGLALASLYLGGGTPSLLRPASVARLIEAVRAAFPVRPADPGPGGPAGDPVEVTLEVNPGTVERERLPGFREAGVGRLSVGVQSFDDAVLRRLGRAHKAAEGRATLDAVRRAGFSDVSIDLLWGVPGRDRAGLARELDEAVAFAPEHVSAYELTVEEGTPYARAVARGQLVPPDPDEAAERYALVRERLAAAGLPAYEISSYARPGRRSRHNQRYWRREPVLGLGPGAWSTEPRSAGAPHGARRGNERALEAWLRRIEDPSPASVPAEPLPPATARGEALLLALRTADGLRAAAFEAEFGAPPRAFHDERIGALVERGLLLESPAGDLRLSERGWPLADAVAIEFLEPAPAASEPLGGLR